jgi:hypothetical protein
MGGALMVPWQCGQVIRCGVLIPLILLVARFCVSVVSTKKAFAKLVLREGSCVTFSALVACTLRVRGLRSRSERTTISGGGR